MVSAQARSSAVDLQYFHARFASWKSQGLSTRAASILALWGCDSVADVQRLGRCHFDRQRNLGAKTLDELSRLAGWPSVCPPSADAARSAPANSDPTECRESAT